MMNNYDNRRERTGEEVPAGLELMHKELKSISWVFNSLAQLKSLPTCKRRISLESALTVMLDEAAISDPFVLNDRVKQLDQKLQTTQTELSETNAELSELRREYVKDPDEACANLTPLINDKISKQRHILIGLGFFFGALSSGIIIFIITRFL
jgi:hypothetical protein